MLSILLYKKPLYNWDTLPYMASVLFFEESDVCRVHQIVYKVAKHEIPAPYYERMVDTTHLHRREVLLHCDKFYSYTSFFKIKPLYVTMSYLMYKAGFPLSRAPLIVTVSCFFGLAVFLFFWLQESMSLIASTILTLSLMLSPAMIESGRCATPDMLSALIFIMALFALYKRRLAATIFLLTIHLLVRVDNLILNVFIIVFVMIYLKEEVRRYRIALALVTMVWIIFAWLLLAYAFPQPDLHSFYQGMATKLSPNEFLQGIVKGLLTIQSSELPLVLGLAIGSAFAFDRGKTMSFFQQIILVISIYIVVKFILFPDLTTRLFLSSYISLWIMTILHINGQLRRIAVYPKE